jgi:hypothetical protein
MNNTEKAAIMEQNYSVFLKHLKERWATVDQPNNAAELFYLLEGEFGKNIITAPASTKVDLVCCYPGGLVEHSLRVLWYMADFRKQYKNNLNLSNAVFSVPSLVVVSLLHDLGKAGLDVHTPYYIDNNSSWHREKLGQLYTINQNLTHWNPNMLSLYQLNKNGVILNEEEYYAISSLYNTKQQFKSEEHPVNGEPILATLLQQAIKLACIQGKQKQEVSLVE